MILSPLLPNLSISLQKLGPSAPPPFPGDLCFGDSGGARQSLEVGAALHQLVSLTPWVSPVPRRSRTS